MTTSRCSKAGHQMVETARGLDDAGVPVLWLMCDRCNHLERREGPPVDDGQLDLFTDQELAGGGC